MVYLVYSRQTLLQYPAVEGHIKKLNDVVIYCLSLMGSNYIDYIKEGFRVLKQYGYIFICEPRKKLEKRLDVFKNELELTGFKVVEVNKTSQFIYLQAIRLI